MKHLAIDDQSMFVKDEISLFHSCIIIPDNDFGDYHAQATYSATYIMWLAKVDKFRHLMIHYLLSSPHLLLLSV